MEIITQTKSGPETEFEKDFIYNFILRDVKEIESRRRVIVYSSNRREKRPSNVRPEDVVIHLSNENLKYNYSFLSRNNTVLRSYYHPFLWKRKCYSIPLGWKIGFFNNTGLEGEHNRYIWTFIGQDKGSRKPMFDSFKDLSPYFSNMSPTWNSGIFSDSEVKQKYLDSAFALVPFGSIHADTMRIMEVLEWGCIPVVVRYLRDDYYKYIFGDHPFIIGKDWDDAKKQVTKLWNDEEALKRKRKEVSVWYRNFKTQLQADVTDIIMGKNPSRCSQWHYQKIGRLNIKMLLIWYYHFYYKKQPLY